MTVQMMKIMYYVCIGMLALLRLLNIHPKLKMCTTMLTRYMSTQEILDGHPYVIFNMIRMSADSFRILSQLLQHKGLLKPFKKMTVEELFIFLTIVC